MAKRSIPVEAKAPELSAAQIQISINRLKQRISEIEAFEPEKVTDRRDPNIDVLEVAIAETIAQTFGRDTQESRHYVPAATLDTAGYNLNGTPHHRVVEGLMHGKERSIVLLKQAIRSLTEKLEDQQSIQTFETPAQEDNFQYSRDVFVVHGHDSQYKLAVADVIRRAGLNPVILHEQPNGGKTIIEKFETHGASAGFAVVLLTPDDVGGPDQENLRSRARQNVIGEMFWFAGKLGRARVCALKRGDIELPSDFAGVIYTEMDERGAWKTDLMKELQAAGYSDLNWGLALS